MSKSPVSKPTKRKTVATPKAKVEAKAKVAPTKETDSADPTPEPKPKHPHGKSTGRKTNQQKLKEKLLADAESARLQRLLDTAVEQQLEDPRKERFASLIARGYSKAEAYLASHPNANSLKYGRNAAWELMKDEAVVRRIRELTGIITTSDMLASAERRRFLARIVRANISTLNVKDDGDLLQEYVISPQGIRIKTPSKLEALLTDAKLAGELIEKVEHSGEVENHITLSDERIDRITEIRKAALQKMKGAIQQRI